MAAFKRDIVTGGKCGIQTGAVEPKDDDFWSLVTGTPFGFLDPTWFLVHADDGVLWGKVENGQPVVPKGVDAICPSATTAWSVRVFNDKAELLLWKDDSTWRWRILSDDGIADSDKKWTEWIEERMMLYGTRSEEVPNGFARMLERDEGLAHIVPLPLGTRKFDDPKDKTPYHPLRLVVRHYLEEDDATGMVKIVASRLVSLDLVKEG